MSPGFALLRSPLLGPGALEPTAAALRQAGSAAFETGAEPDGHEAEAQAIAAALPAGAILAPHSGAGGLVPAIAAAAGSRLAGVIFLDALLPHPGRSWFDTAPASLAEAVVAHAEQGLAPPWSRWLAPAALARLVPDAAQRSGLIDACPRVPLARLAQAAPSLDLPPGLACAFLRLSAAYEPEAGEAERRGWPVLRLDGDHLWPLTRPADVAEALCALAAALAR